MALVVKNPPANAGFLPRKSHGWRSLVGCSPWGHEKSDTTERLHFHFSLSCIGEGNGNPLQCSCLENPRDGEAWWTAVYGVAQSRTRLKWLSSSSSSQCRRHKRCGFNSWVRKIPLRRAWQPTPVFLPGESHEQRSLASVHGVAKSQTWLNWLSMHTCMYSIVIQYFCRLHSIVDYYEILGITSCAIQ